MGAAEAEVEPAGRLDGQLGLHAAHRCVRRVDRDRGACRLVGCGRRDGQRTHVEELQRALVFRLERRNIEAAPDITRAPRSEEHTSELQSLMRNSYAVFCLTKKTKIHNTPHSAT